MIYINNNTNTIVITDIWLNYIPTKLLIKFDNIEIGLFDNISTRINYLEFEIPGDIIKSIKLENMEYQMKIYVDYALIKQELVQVISNKQFNIIDINNDINIKMKENE